MAFQFVGMALLAIGMVPCYAGDPDPSPRLCGPVTAEAGILANGHPRAVDGMTGGSSQAPESAAPDVLGPWEDLAPAGDEDTREVDDDQQETDVASSDKPYWRTNLFHRFFSDQKYLFTDWLPSEVHRPGFIYPMMLGTALALAQGRDSDASQPDVSFERDFSSDTGGAALGIAHGVTTIGNGPQGFFLLGTGYLIGRWSGHDRFAEASSLGAQAALDTGLWVSVLKTVFARTRPSGGGTGQFFQYHPQDGQVAGSFPSGHASGAFAAATVFANLYREDHPWVPWAAYGTATLVAISRVALGRHFPTDVFVGALIGNSFGRMVVSRDHPSEKRVTSGIAPLVDPTIGGEGVVWHREW